MNSAERTPNPKPNNRPESAPEAKTHNTLKCLDSRIHHALWFRLNPWESGNDSDKQPQDWNVKPIVPTPDSQRKSPGPKRNLLSAHQIQNLMLRPLPQTRKATRTCEAYMPRHIPNSEKPSQPSEGPTDLKALKEPFKPYTLARPLRGGDRRPEVLRAQRARTQPPKIGFPQPCRAALELNCKGRMNPVEENAKFRMFSFLGSAYTASVEFVHTEGRRLCALSILQEKNLSIYVKDRKTEAYFLPTSARQNLIKPDKP